MQIGWCSNHCSFNENSGVGDSKLSYGYDGSKQQIWHISTKKYDKLSIFITILRKHFFLILRYGEKWQTGDIIGICIDVDNEKIEYFRNGESMGPAFTKLEKGPSISFFPAVSLGYNQGVKANFGGTPFKYPIPGYMAFQPKPLAHLEKVDLVLGYLVNLSNILAHKEKKSKNSKSTKKTLYVVFCTMLVEKISLLILDSYVIEDKLLNHIRNQCAVR